MFEEIFLAFETISLLIGFPWWILLIITTSAGIVLGIIIGLRFRKNAVILLVSALVIGFGVILVLWLGSVLTMIQFLAYLLLLLVFPLGFYVSVVLASIYGTKFVRQCKITNPDSVMCKLVGVNDKTKQSMK